jgi:hypothetical protein
MRHGHLFGIVAAAAVIAAPAAAQIRIGVGGVDARVKADIRVGEPYSYRGYHSGRWYPYERPRHGGYWHADYGGYDCYRAFQYTWHDGYQARYDSWWCHNDRRRAYEVRRTRVVARIG